MRKKPFIIIGAVIAAILVTLAIIKIIFPSSFTSAAVAVTLPQSDVSADIFVDSENTAKGANKVATITQNTTINVPYGSYYYIASGKNVAPGMVKFEVTGNRPLEINPPLLDTYLDTLLDPEESMLADIIRQTYPLIAQSYTIQPGRLYDQGQWYGTTLVNKKSTQKDPYDVYRIVLLKENGKWQTMTKPELLISSVDYPGIPVDILRTLNRLDPVLSPEPTHISND